MVLYGFIIKKSFQQNKMYVHNSAYPCIYYIWYELLANFLYPNIGDCIFPTFPFKGKRKFMIFFTKGSWAGRWMKKVLSTRFFFANFISLFGLYLFGQQWSFTFNKCCLIFSFCRITALKSLFVNCVDF